MSERNLSPERAACSELLAFYRAEIRFESEVVNGRLHALLASQSFLIIAYATAMTGSTQHWGSEMVLILPLALALLGFLLALLAWPGIRAAHDAIARWETKENDLHKRTEHLRDYTLVANEGDIRATMRRGQEGALFALRAPFVFLVAWLFFALLPIYLYF